MYLPMRLIIIGGGGFGREALDIVEAINSRNPTFQIVGVVDDQPSALTLERLKDRDYRHLGGISMLRDPLLTDCFVVAIGAPLHALASLNTSLAHRAHQSPWCTQARLWVQRQLSAPAVSSALEFKLPPMSV